MTCLPTLAWQAYEYHAHADQFDNDNRGVAYEMAYEEIAYEYHAHADEFVHNDNRGGLRPSENMKKEDLLLNGQSIIMVRWPLPCHSVLINCLCEETEHRDWQPFAKIDLEDNININMPSLIFGR